MLQAQAEVLSQEDVEVSAVVELFDVFDVDVVLVEFVGQAEAEHVLLEVFEEVFDAEEEVVVEVWKGETALRLLVKAS
ncbi:MAG: hypothetical protein AB7E52_09500, partial [Bdellovibrionales bacterium]